MQLAIYIDTSSNRLLAGLNLSTAIVPTSLPLFVGDTLSLQVYLMIPLPTFTASVENYAIISTAGLSLLAYLTNGQDSSSIDYEQYTQQVVWTSDPTGQYFYANLALNTPALVTLIGDNENATANLVIGYLQNGVPRTVLNVPINLQAGVPTSNLVVPAGLTPLSVEAAVGMFVPIAGVPANAPLNTGQGFFQTTPLGKKGYIHLDDDGAGGIIWKCDPV